MKKNIFDKFKEICNKYPEREAVISQGKRFTYSQMYELVTKLSQALLEQGAIKGDRVAVLLRNTYQTVVSYLAILKIGAIEVALNPVMDSPEVIMYALKDCSAKFLISNNNYLKNIKDELIKDNFLEVIFSVDSLEESTMIDAYKYLFFEKVFEAEVKEEVNIAIEENDLALIMYSSGTTGLPKGVMLTHFNIFSTAQTAAEDLDLDVDKCLLLIPLYHAYGKQEMNSRFLKGNTVIFCENILFPMEILNLINKEKVTGIITVPAIYVLLVRTIMKSKEKIDFSFLKYIQSGGASLTYELILHLRTIFDKAILLYGYGMTEAGTRIALNKFNHNVELLEAETQSCGKPHKDDKVAIIDDSGNRLKAGELGEIIFQGKGIMKGYWNNREETEKVLIDGWLHTGDLGKIDETGRIFITSRKKDIIKMGGEIISPKEIEIVINSHPQVKESAVIGIPDKLLGEKVKAYVVKEERAQLSTDEIKELCSQKLSFSKIPAIIEFIEALPKSTLEKVKKSELRRLSS